MVAPQPGSLAPSFSSPLSPMGLSMPDNQVLPDTWSGIHPFQVFDFNISQQDATKHAYRYDFVWGTGKPNAWKTGNSSIVTSWYAPFDGDFTLNHNLNWWLSNHPSWVLYKCDGKRLASLDGLKNVPLDISNPAVVQWQMQMYGPQIESQGYNALAEDLVSLNNSTGGCGVYVNGKWTPRFSGQKIDAAWTAATLKWHEYAYSYLHGLSRPIMIAVNAVPESELFGDPDEQKLIAHVDVIDDESSFTNYGTGYASSQKVGQILQWMKYAQNQGRAYIVDDKWNTHQLSQQQFDWGLSTYLLGKYHLASIFIDHDPGYGQEYWVQQYDAKVGSPCADSYLDPNNNGVTYRKYSGAFIAINANTTSGVTVRLPKPSYTDIWGKTVTSPLHLGPDASAVLLTTANGCS